MPQQIILGVCNPQLAHKALPADPEIGLLLPCNVTVRQDGQQVIVAAIDVERLMTSSAIPELRPIAQEAKRRLQAILERI